MSATTRPARRSFLAALAASIAAPAASVATARPAAAGADLSSIKDAANNLGAALAARHGAACRVVVNDESRFILILTDFDAEGGAQ